MNHETYFASLIIYIINIKFIYLILKLGLKSNVICMKISKNINIVMRLDRERRGGVWRAMGRGGVGLGQVEGKGVVEIEGGG